MSISIDNTEQKRNILAVKKLFSGKPRYIYTVTFGCQQNEADTEKILGIAKEMGCLKTESPENADIIILNTCAIREHAELKALSLLGRFKLYKKKNPELIIGVMGCMAAEEHIKNMLKTDFHYVSFTIPPMSLHKLPEYVLKSALERKRSFAEFTENAEIVEGTQNVRRYTHKAWVSVMYGCNNFCSYCIVPYVRGRERSRESAEIINECRELVNSGCKEITLLGQNVNSYHSDIDFPDLLKSIAELDGDFIIRFMTSHPKDASDKLIEVIGKYNGKIAPYFHLPLQSGSNRILKAMNRTYTREKFMEVVEKLRSTVPNIAISSDIIVGFPGETDEDFEETLDVLRRVRFDMVYSFIYSVRKGTRAALMDNKVERAVADARMSRLLTLATDISYEKNLKCVGSEVRVLVDGPTKNGAPNVYDGRTPANKLVHFELSENKTGEFINVKIDRAGAFDLFASKKED